MFRDAAWMNEAACSDVPTRLFFPKFERVSAEIEALCGSCPVRRQCLDYALARPKTVGIWAATTSNQRTAMLRGRRRSLKAA